MSGPFLILFQLIKYIIKYGLLFYIWQKSSKAKKAGKAKQEEEQKSNENLELTQKPIL